MNNPQNTPSPPTILDAHVHLWDVRGTPRPVQPLLKLFGWHPKVLHGVAGWAIPAAQRTALGKLDYALSNYLSHDVNTDTAHHQVKALVHAEAGWHGKEGSVGETHWLERTACRAVPPVKAIVAYTDLTSENVKEILKSHQQASQAFKGVRLMLSYSEDKNMVRWCPAPRMASLPAFRRGYAQLAEFGLSFDAWMYHTQLEELIALAKAHPEVPLVLNHLGTPVGIGGPFGPFGHNAAARDEIRRQWLDSLARLAELPHVHVKLSGLLMPVCGFGFHQRPTPPTVEEYIERLAPLILPAIDLFGVHRCMFASNFPMDKVSITYSTLFDVFSSIVSHFPPAARHQLFYETAASFYRIS